MRDDDALRRAQEAAAEAELRRLKESLVPQDRHQALKDLFRAEVYAMLECEQRRIAPLLVAAVTPAEGQAVVDDFERALLAGVRRIHNQILEQGRSWTIGGLEALEREMRGLFGGGSD